MRRKINTKCVVITGANSKIVYPIYLYFRDKGYKIYLYSRKNLIKNINVVYNKIDFEDENFKFKYCFESPEYVIHGAWNTRNDYLHSKKNSVWLKNSKIFFNSFKNLKHIKIITFGSCAEYDWNDKNILYKNNQLNPINNYGRSKLKLYMYLKNKLNFKHILWLRYFFLFGNLSKKNSLIMSSINKIKNNRKIYLSKPYDKLDFIYDQDAIKISLKLIQRNKIGVYNISTGNKISILDFVKIVQKILNKKNLIYFENKDYNRKVIHGSSKKLINNKIITKYKIELYNSYIKKNIKKIIEEN